MTYPSSPGVGELSANLDEIEMSLFVAGQELESIPYTAPEVIVARLRELVPVASTLVDEVRALQAEVEAGPWIACPIPACSGDMCILCNDGEMRLPVGPETDAALRAVLVSMQAEYDGLAARADRNLTDAEAERDALRAALEAAVSRVAAMARELRHLDQFIPAKSQLRLDVAEVANLADHPPLVLPSEDTR